MRTMDDGNRLDTRSRGRRLWAVGVFLTVFLCMLCGSLTTALAGTYGRDSLGSGTLNRKLYDLLEKKIKAVAAGTQTETEFPITFGDIGISDEQLTITLENPILYDSNDTSNIGQAAEDAMGQLLDGYDFNAVISALLVDHPYELYWYDKKNGASAPTRYSYSASISGGYVTSIQISANTEDTNAIFIFKFSVSSDYGSGYTVNNSTNVERAKQAAENAQTIVNQYANLSDYNKLLAFKDAICNAVSYNHPAAENKATPYGDPWQLVNVFDGDADTTVVCEGYSKAFQYLCDLSGITCYSVSGEMKGGTGEGPHMWNIVELGGQHYLVDVTNCDEGSIGNPDKLFLKGYDTQEAVTVFNDDETDSTASTKYGIYVENGTTADTITFTYDYDTVKLYDADILTLATTDYDSTTTPTEPTALTIAGATVADKTYDGKTDATVTGVTFSANGETVSLMKDTDYTVTALFADENAGENKSVTVTVTLTDTGAQKYTLESNTYNATATIRKATATVTWPQNSLEIEYTGGQVQFADDQKPQIILATGETHPYDPSYKYCKQGETNYIDGLPTDVGTYTVQAVFDGGKNYESVSAEITLTITQKKMDAPTGVTVTGEKGKLNVKWDSVSNASGYSVQLLKDNTATGEPVTLGGESNTNTSFTIGEAGTYTVSVTATGNSNYTDSDAATTNAVTFHQVTWQVDDTTSTTEYYPSGSTIEQPTTNPTKEGYTFAGWTVNGEAWVETDTVMQDMTLTATWTPVGSVTVKDVTFAPQPYGYAQPAGETINITRTGNVTIGSVTVNDNNMFAITQQGDSTYTIAPVSGLGVGEHTATVTVTYNGDKQATATVSFTVNKATRPTPAAPTVLSTTADTITVQGVTGQKYAISTENSAPARNAEGWQEPNAELNVVFGNVNPSTNYWVFTYIPGDVNHEDSPVSEGTPTTTDAPAPTGLTTNMFTVGASKTYNGAGQGVSISSTTLAETDYTVTYAPVEGGTGALDESGLPKDAGEYTVTIAAAEGSAYTGNVTYTLTITPATLTASANGVSVSKTYDGTTGAGTLQGDVTITGKIDNDDVSVTATPGAYDSADAGESYTVTLTLALDGADAGNYTLGQTTTLTVNGRIDPAAPVIAWAEEDLKQTAAYTGSEVSVKAPTVTLVEGETYSQEQHGAIQYSYRTSDAETWTPGLPTNAGTYTVHASIEASQNYAAATTEKNLTLTISPNALAAPTVMLTSSAPGTLTATWGEVDNATDYSVQLDSGEAVTATGTSHTFDVTSAGGHTVTVTAKDSSGNYTENAGNASATFYTVTWDANGGAPQPESPQLYISGSKLTAPTAPTKAYHTFAGWTVDGEAWNFETDTVTQNVTLTAKWMEVGAVTVADVTFDAQPYGYTQPEAKNLDIAVPEGSQVDSVTVDSTEFTVEGSGANWTIQPAEGLAAGEHEATITVTYNGGKEAKATVSFTVNKATRNAPLSPTVHGGQTTANSITVETVAGQRYIITESANTPATSEGDWTDAAAENGEHTFTGLTPNTPYYIYTYIPSDASYEDSPVSIGTPATTKEAEKTPLTFDMFTVSASRTYTAQEQAADITTDLSADAYTVSYAVNESGALGDNDLPKDAGSYAIRIEAVEGSGYTGSLQDYFTIAPAAVTITPNEASWTYGQTAPKLTYTTNLTAGSALASAFDSAQNIALTYGGDGYAGTYPIAASTLDAGDNFTLTLDESKSVTINPAVQTLATVSPLTLTVGQSVSLTGHVTSDQNAAISYAVMSGGASIDGDTLTASAVGTVKVKASASAVDVNGDDKPEYNAAEMTFDVTVTAKATDETSMKLDVQSVTYGENVAPNVSGKPDGAGDIAYTYSGTTAGGASYNSSEAPTQAGSYTVTARCESATTVYTAQASFTINPATLTVASAVAQNKPYDGTTAANVTVTLSGAVNGETLTPGTDYTVDAQFDSAAAGEGKTVNVTVALLNANYTFEGGKTHSQTLTAAITPLDAATPVKPIAGLTASGLGVNVSNAQLGQLYMILPASADAPTAQSDGWQAAGADGTLTYDNLTPGEYVVYTCIPATEGTNASGVVASDPVLVSAPAQAPDKPVVSATATGASVSFTSAAKGQMYMILLRGAAVPTADSAGWQAIPEGGVVTLDGLTPGEYVVYTYVPAEEGAAAASAVVASDPVSVSAPATPPTANVAGGATSVVAEPGVQAVMAVEPVEGATYQWYINRGDGKGYVAIEGATQPTYTTTPVNAGNDGFTYYCEVTNAAGTVRSAVITLRVAQMPQTGDPARPMLWAALLLACLGAMWALRPARRGNGAAR